VPAALIARLPKVATPVTALAMTALPLLSVSVTAELSPATTFPLASSTATVTGGLRGTPMVPLPGCRVKASFVGSGW